MANVWITGAEGGIAKRLVKLLGKDIENRIITTDKDVDITDLEAVEQAMDIYRPEVVINCASLSNAAYCAEHEVEAYKVNALGARNLAYVTSMHNAKLIQLSTDDVFSGENNRSKNEFDVPTPNTIYGKSKLAGENCVRELNPKHLIIRSSWVYGSETPDYVDYVLEKAEKGESFEASLDQISTPTSAESIADFIAVMIKEREYGIYHASDEGMCTRYQYAVKILTDAGYDPALAVGTFSKKDRHIVSTLLDNLMMKMTEVYTMPNWEEDLEKYVKAIKGEK